MGVQIAVVTSSGGIPVFTCGSDGGPIPFPVLGSLNGVWLFCKSNGGELRVTANDHGLIVWKEFLDKLSVICICTPGGPYIPECLADNIIDLCYGAIVMGVGTEGLKNFTNAELLKRDLKSSAPVISHILASFVPGKERLFAPLTGMSDVVICEETPKLQELVEGFCEKSETPYGLLTIGGRVVAASLSWWTALTHAEKALFLIFALLQDNGVARDCPVYLPVKSPSVPYRLVSLTLLESSKEDERVCLCLLCGSTPALADVMRQAPSAFGHVADLLKTIASSSSPSSVPRHVVLHSTVHGLLCLNLERGRSFCHVRKEPVWTSTREHVGDAPVGGNLGCLAAVFCDTREFFSFQRLGIGGGGGGAESQGTGQSFDSQTSDMPCTEVYQNYGTHQCYGLERWPYQLYVLFEAGVPRNAMQSMTHDVLDALTNPKAAASF